MSASRLESSPRQQKDLVKRGLDVPLREGTAWFPVAMEWWYSWRQYVSYDNDAAEAKSDEEVEALNPGPINNTPIGLDGTEELKPGLVEGQHYVLLPETIYKRLKAIFGVEGPEFERKVIKQGGQATLLQVELYPLKFMTYLCNPDGSAKPEPAASVLISRGETVQAAKRILAAAVDATHAAPRFWLKVANEENGSKDDGAESTSSPETEGKEAQDPWQLVFNDSNSQTSNEKLITLLPDAREVTVLVETRTDTGYPRDAILNRWRHDLKVGDLVDAIDTDHRWFEAVVTDVNNEKKEVKVHYKGWSSKWDSWVRVDSDNIQKLHTKTNRWRENLEIGSAVELKVTQEPEQPRWYQATVQSVEGNKVTVTCPQTAKKVVDLDGEDICEMYTHIKRPQDKKTAESANAGYSSYSYYSRSNTKGTPPAEGAVGLSNLGNTCFMNSMLQCISNSGPITEYFLADEHRSEINTDNPLGMNGKLAVSYAKLLKEMWSGKFTVVVPSDFKRTIGEYAPQFAGFQQQDSQELMSFLLDGLHEDLNRVKRKPYVETVESKGRADDLVSREAWRRFLLRNDSAIVDRCYGLLKSHVRCTGCGFESITFDPYLSLSLPIPVQNQREIDMLVYPLPIGTRPVSIRVQVPLTANTMDLKAEIIRLLKDDYLTVRCPVNVMEDGRTEDVPGERTETTTRSAEVQPPGHAEGIYLHVCASFNPTSHRVYKTAEDRQAVQEAVRSTDDVIVFQLESPAPTKVVSYPYGSSYTQRREPAPPVSNSKFVDVLIGVKGKKTYYASSAGLDLVGPPYRLAYNDDSTKEEICQKVWQYFKHFVHEEAQHKYSASNPPYELHVTTTMGSSSKSILQSGPERVSTVLGLYDSLTIVLTPETEDDLDKEEFERVNQHPSTVRTATAAASTGISLEQCFAKFVEREQLGAQEQWFCPSCKQHLAPLKKFDIWAAPDILIIHLKRFQYIPGTYFVHREKINDLISFPIEELDLSEYVKGPKPDDAPPIYELYAVSEHSGGLGGGHYTAAAKNHRNNRWYSFNDSHVSETSPQQHVTSRAYVLFYRRKRGAARWAGIVPLEADLDQTHSSA